MSPVTGVEVSLTVSIRESFLVSLSETSHSILLSLVSIGPQREVVNWQSTG